MLSIGLAQANTGTIFDVGPFNLGLELDKPQQAIFEMELDSLSPGPACPIHRPALPTLL